MLKALVQEQALEQEQEQVQEQEQEQLQGQGSRSSCTWSSCYRFIVASAFVTRCTPRKIIPVHIHWNQPMPST